MGIVVPINYNFSSDQDVIPSSTRSLSLGRYCHLNDIMNKLQILTCLFISSLLLTGYSCQKGFSGVENNTAGVIASNPTKLPDRVDFESKGHSKNISLGTLKNVKFTITSNKNWCRAVQQGNTLKISVDLNDDTEIRQAVLTVRSGGAEAKINIRQLGTDPAILVDHDIFSLPSIGGNLDFEITTNVKLDVKLPDWITPPNEARAMRKEQRHYVVLANKNDTKRSGQIEIIQTNPQQGVAPLRKLITIHQDGLAEYAYGATENIPQDEKIKVVSGSASSFQNPDIIEKSFDGDYSTIYHSAWANGSPNYYPITLTYNFAEATNVDYVVYYPRTSGYNGHFHKFELQYSLDGNTYTKIDDYELIDKVAPTRLAFEKPIRAKSFRFVVRKGYGDRAGFVSCAEMEFFKQSDKSFDYKSIFANDLCTVVRPNITDPQIAAISDPFFRNLALYVKHGRYEKEFRVASYKPYQHPAIIASKNKTHACSILDNPTGIYVKEGEDLIAFVGNTYGYKDLGIRVQNLDKPGGDGFNDPVYYPLSQGFNKIRMTKPGLIYVLYLVGEGQADKMKPIDIHFATGTVNGYYNSQDSKLKDRWKELLGKASYKYFDVLGKYAHLTFETQAFKDYTPEGIELTKTYDSIVHNEWILHGYYKYPQRKPLSRMYLHVMYHSFMYATSYHTAYVNGTQKDILNPNKMRDPKSQGAAWGPSHELGHVNQVSPGLKWRGMTEVTVNIPSQYITTYVFKQPSRLQEEPLQYGNNRYTKAFTELIAKRVPFSKVGDVFCNLVPFWQLELYFGKTLGLTPRLSADGHSGFYPDLYEFIRQEPNQPNPGTQQTEFPYSASRIGKKNLTHFFEQWGFFREVDVEINDYSKEQMTVTKQRADAVKDRIKKLNLPDMKHIALEYITDNNSHLYKNPDKILLKGQNASISGNTIRINGWKNTVAFEIYDEKNNLFFIADASYPELGRAVFTINKKWNSKYTIKAVSAGNARDVVPHN